jgi:CBS domain-containing protein
MDLEYKLTYEPVTQLDLTVFTQVERNATVKETVAQMRRMNGYCALVMDQGVLAGIFTGWDILKKVVNHPEIWDHPIAEVMTTTPLFTVTPEDRTDVALTLMDEHYVRDIPVVTPDGHIVGNITHYAMVKYLADHFPETIYNLPPEPDRVARNRIGA